MSSDDSVARKEIATFTAVNAKQTKKQEKRKKNIVEKNTIKL